VTLGVQAAVDRPADAGAGEVSRPDPPSRWRYVVLFTLLLVNVVNYADRSLVSVLAQPIKIDLGLGDTELGLLSGLAFAVVYSLLSLPMARVADSGRQRLVIMASAVVWSAMTVAGGFARSFAQLAVSRLGVAIGEAGLQPASHSLICSLFDVRRRALALSVFTIGTPLGIAACSAIGGLLADRGGWRLAFFVVGGASIVTAPLARFILPRGQARVGPATQIAPVVRRLFSLRPYRTLWIAFALAGSYGYTSGTFAAAFYMRTFGLTAGQVGAVYGVVLGAAGIVAVLGGGFLQDVVAKGSFPRAMSLLALGLLISAGCAVTGWLTPNLAFSVVMVTTSQMLYLAIAAPLFAVAQSVVEPEQRGMSSAVMNMAGGLVAATLGPLLAGMISDALTPSLGVHALRVALVVMCIFLVLASAGFFATARALRD
jgi:predicted MFS family arabinose efflux permease